MTKNYIDWKNRYPSNFVSMNKLEQLDVNTKVIEQVIQKYPMIFSALSK